ncbi:MAG: hypothetical protein HY303_12100 [Candidatus Wallbacteria bacterium]|nr:hypothetical protein [Candidatus Wallbacteria bacterium]
MRSRVAYIPIRSMLWLLLGVWAAAPSALACCGDGPILGPRPATPLMERDPAGGPVEVLTLQEATLSPRAAAGIRASLAMLPGVGRVEVDASRKLARIGFRDKPVPVAALIEAVRLAGAGATATRMSRIALPDAAAKGRARQLEARLMAMPAVVDFELELEGREGVARVWHGASVTQSALRAALGAPVSPACPADPRGRTTWAAACAATQ